MPFPEYDDRALSVACPLPGSAATSTFVFRDQPEDFVVEEVPAYLPSGKGEHLYLHIEKRGISTRALVQALCAIFKLEERDVGYAGQKDERAVATQWISVPARKVDPDKLVLEGVKVLEAKLHDNKLRLGHSRGNRFTVALTRAASEAPLPPLAEVAAEFETSRPVPNLFGMQRFGHDGRTIVEAERFLTRNRRATSRRERFWVSALQSSLFNAWLADRVDDGTWRTPLAGDVLEKSLTGAPFWCEDPVVDGARAAAGEVVVAGPLVGAGMRPARLDALTAESRSWSKAGVDVAALCTHPAFDVGARRPATLFVQEIDVTPRTEGLTLRFSLPKGSYASVVLRAWLGGSLVDAAFADGDADSSPQRS